MAKKIRFPLQMNGKDIRSIEDLRENYNMESILCYYLDGKLVKWLNQNYYDSMAEQIKALSPETQNINAELCKILGVNYNEEDNTIILKRAKRRNEKLALLKQDTNDENMLSKIDAIALNQSDLLDIYDIGKEKVIYLYKGEYEISLKAKDITYKGIGNPIVYLKAYDNVNFNSLNLKFIDIYYAWDISETTNADEQRQAEEFINIGKVKEAIEIMKHLAETGHPRAKYVLYMITDRNGAYHNSYDIYNALREKRVLKISKKLSEKGDKFSQCVYAECFFKNYGQEADKSKAKNILFNAASAGHSFSQWAYAEKLYSGDFGTTDYKEVIEWTNKAVQKENPKALFLLALCCLQGKGTNENKEEALRLFKKAGDLGYIHSYYFLARNYYPDFSEYLYGKNYSEAIKWYNKCISEGAHNDIDVIKSQIALATMYLKGYGVEQDYEKAYEYFRKSNKSNYLGYCYYMGISVEKNYDKAQELFEKYITDELDSGVYNKERIDEIGNDFYYGRDYICTDYNEAVKWYRKAADLDYANSQYMLGYCYYNGHGIANDYNEAVKWYRKAAEQGHEKALTELGSCYMNGIGVAKDTSEAAKCYRKSSEMGEHRAQFYLGSLYENGIGVYKDINEAIKWYLKSAEQGDNLAQLKLGEFYEKGIGVKKDINEAAKWYNKAAKQGNTAIYLKLGEFYENGIGVTQDLNEAFKWYLKAAEQGDSSAQLKVGKFYENAIGVAQNYTEAAEWYRRAAEQGNVTAQICLGRCYQGVPGINYKKIEEWFRKAADSGNAIGMVELGHFLQDSRERAKWYNKAAELGDYSVFDNVLPDLYKLAGEYLHSERGYPFKQNTLEALRWHTISAERGFVSSQAMLGCYYYFGLSWEYISAPIPQNYTEAVKWLRKAAEQGHNTSQYYLAQCYENGTGVTQDINEAIKWYQKAAEQGVNSARESLHRLGKTW